MTGNAVVTNIFSRRVIELEQVIDQLRDEIDSLRDQLAMAETTSVIFQEGQAESEQRAAHLESQVDSLRKRWSEVPDELALMIKGRLQDQEAALQDARDTVAQLTTRDIRPVPSTAHTDLVRVRRLLKRLHMAVTDRSNGDTLPARCFDEELELAMSAASKELEDNPVEVVSYD